MRDPVTDLLTRQTLALAESLVNNAEPLKARMLLEQCSPNQVERTPEVLNLLQRIQKATAHAEDASLYDSRYSVPFKELYALQTDPVPFSDRDLLLLDRAKRTLASIAAIYNTAPDGTTLRVLSVGGGDGTLEKVLLSHHAHLHLTVCEKNPTASAAVLALQALFPDRVESVDDLTPDAFDVVFCLEVIEHVQDEAAFAHALAGALKEGGTLLFSTPNGSQWYEPIHMERLLTNSEHWCQHLRAFSPHTLGRLMATTGLLGNLMITPQKTLYYRGDRQPGPLQRTVLETAAEPVLVPVDLPEKDHVGFLTRIPVGQTARLPSDAVLPDGSVLVMYHNVLLTSWETAT